MLGASAGIAQDSKKANSTTQSGISGIAGNAAVRTGDKDSGIAPIFNKQQVQEEIQAQIAITAAFGKQASTAWGNYATERQKKAQADLKQAQESQDPEAIVKAKKAANCWSSTGVCRAAGHAAIGGLTTGSTQGAVGGGLASITAPRINQALAKANVKGPAAQALTTILTAAVGSAAGTAGAVAATNEVGNNFLYASEAELYDHLVEARNYCGDDQKGRSEVQAKINHIVKRGRGRDRKLRSICGSNPSAAQCLPLIKQAEAAAASYEGKHFANVRINNHKAHAEKIASLYRYARQNPTAYGTEKAIKTAIEEAAVSTIEVPFKIGYTTADAFINNNPESKEKIRQTANAFKEFAKLPRQKTAAYVSNQLEAAAQAQRAGNPAKAAQIYTSLGLNTLAATVGGYAGAKAVVSTTGKVAGAVAKRVKPKTKIGHPSGGSANNGAANAGNKIPVPDNLSKNVHNGAQGKHIKGHNNYKLGKSVLDVDPQELLSGIHKGKYSIIRTTIRGNSKSYTVDFGKKIGTFKMNGTTVGPTRYGQVVDGKNGVHIIPANPKQY